MTKGRYLARFWFWGLAALLLLVSIVLPKPDQGPDTLRFWLATAGLVAFIVGCSIETWRRHVENKAAREERRLADQKLRRDLGL